MQSVSTIANSSKNKNTKNKEATILAKSLKWEKRNCKIKFKKCVDSLKVQCSKLIDWGRRCETKRIFFLGKNFLPKLSKQAKASFVNKNFFRNTEKGYRVIGHLKFSKIFLKSLLSAFVPDYF